MPAGFPRSRPTIRVISSFPGTAPRHAILDSAGFVTASPELGSWTASEPVIRPLKAVMDHFARDPPVLVSSAPAPAPAPPSWSGPYSSIPGGVPATSSSLPPPPYTSASTARGQQPPPYGSTVWAGRDPGSLLPAYPSTSTPPTTATTAAAATTFAARTPAPAKSRTKKPPVPSSFAALDSKSYAVLSVLQVDSDSRREFLKENVEALRLLRESVRVSFCANRDAAAGLASAVGQEGTSGAEVERLGEAMALLQVERAGLEDQLRAKLGRVKALNSRFAGPQLSSLLATKASEAEASSDDFRAKLVRGEGRPAGGTPESAERKAWLEALVGEYQRRRERFHRLSALSELVASHGVDTAPIE
jgi:hypothetical protein